jgi:enolase
MDVAASEFFHEGKYDLDFKTKNNDKSQLKTSDELSELYKEFVHDFAGAVPFSSQLTLRSGQH